MFASRMWSLLFYTLILYIRCMSALLLCGFFVPFSAVLAYRPFTKNKDVVNFHFYMPHALDVVDLAG
ncbi:hypothetical protein Plhal304r1_c027g0091411 [Plasmopara halstedii]